MKSVRILAGGAVVLFALSLTTAPVRACDDRFIKACEAEAEAAFLAETQGGAATGRRKAPRMRAAVAEKAPEKRAPRLWTKRAAPAAEPAAAPPVATANVRATPTRESPLAKRFRGFIDPQSMAVNSFEALRPPRLDTEHLAPVPALPASDMSAVASADETAVAEVTTVAVPAKVQPIALAQAATPFATLAQAIEPSPAGNDQPGGFPFHKLVLTLCAALGVASALRFIVRA